MAGFIRKKVETYTLGEKLRSLREEAGVPLAEIAKATKIRKVYLEKIEAGLYDELPAAVYVKGFLRSYAKYMNIEQEDVVRHYEKERGIQNSIKKRNETKERNTRFRVPMVTVTPKMFTIAASVFLIFAGVIYFYREIGKFSETPRLVIVQPSSDVSIDGSKIDIVGITDVDTKISINEQPVFVNEKGEFNETISLQQGVNQIVVKAFNRFGKDATKSYNISANYDMQEVLEARSENEAVQVAGAEDAQLAQKVKVEIRIEDVSTWVSVTVDGNNVQSGTMLPGSMQTFEAAQQISVTSGKANKTMIIFNGNEIGALGDTPGIIRDVIFTKDTKIMPEVTTLENTESENADEAPVEEPKKNEDDNDRDDKTTKKKK
jgi:cytoskeletal protein RodZ